MSNKSDTIIASLSEIGPAVRAIRKQADLTQSEVAERGRISRQRVVDVESSNPTNITMQTFLSVLTVLGYQIRIEPAKRRPNLMDLNQG